MDGATVTAIVGLAGVLGGVFAAWLTFRGQRLSTEQERVAMLFEAQDRMLSSLRAALGEVEEDLEQQRVSTQAARTATLRMVGVIYEMITITEALLPRAQQMQKRAIEARIHEIRQQLETEHERRSE